LREKAAELLRLARRLSGDFYTPSLAWVFDGIKDRNVVLEAVYDREGIGIDDPHRVVRICKAEFQRHLLPHVARVLGKHGLEVRSMDARPGKHSAFVTLRLGPEAAENEVDREKLSDEIREAMDR